MKRNLLSLLMVIAVIWQLSAQDLVRGPYMQNLTQTSVKVMWRTSAPTQGWVKVGSSPDNLTLTFTGSADATNHIVDITGLNPYQQYFYSIGYGDITLSGGDVQHTFRTAKIAGDTSGIRAWVIGDFGKGNQAQDDVMTSFVNYNPSNPVDFGIMLGDNVYNDGTDDEYQRKLFTFSKHPEIFKYLNFYSTPGNHDYNMVNRLDDPRNHRGPYYEIFKSLSLGEAGGVPSNSHLYYSFDYGHVHFISLNSELIQWTGINNSPMEQWLRQDLEANRQPWTVVFFHQPPYASGSHISDDIWQLFMKNMRERFNPIFDKYSVDLVINGHSHMYERSMLIHGHYGRSPQFKPEVNLIQGGTGNPDTDGPYVKTPGGKGTVYAVVGNSGSSEGDYPVKGHPVFVARDGGSSVCGSLILEVKGSMLTGSYLSSTGEIKDKFAIFKQIAQSTPIKENFAERISLKAFPNPASEQLQVSFIADRSLRGSILVNDLSGRQVLSQTIQVNPGAFVVSIDNWKDLPLGNYLVNVELDGNPAVVSVVKAR